VCAGVELNVAVVEADEFGQAQTGLDGQGYQGAVSAAFPAAAGVRGGEQSVDLVGGQEGHRGVPVEARRTNPARVVSRNARKGRGCLSASAP
jgi:hypothetical protein